ncbi:FecR domain-containing protein [Candidatus Uabimicrobium sp. HlEnr_7]|uniref:FecR domain-containing protein n=1 Tax=Candidatus Uabimicrobium helgolandensis TaxID=3095367 RepID=UPI0035575BB7
MISCPSNEDLLAFHKNELEDSKSIGLHIDQCKKCSGEITTLNKHLQLYSQVKTPQFTPKDINWASLIDSPLQPKKPRVPFLQIAASFLLLTMAIYFSLPQTPTIQLTHGLLYQADKNIKAGDFIPTNKVIDAGSVVKFSMGSVQCNLAPGTKMKISGPDSVQLIDGNAYFNVVPGNSLTIQTTHGTAQVLGTEFLVSVTSKITEVDVYSGKVKFVDDNNKEYILPKGKRIDSSLLKIQTNKDTPSWVNQPLLLRTADGSKKAIAVFATNLTSSALYLKRFSGTPNFLFHIRNLQTNEEYQTPVFSKNKQSFVVEPQRTQKLTISKAQLLKNRGKYEITLIFQDQIQGDNPWSGIVRSSSIVIDYN